MNVRTNRRPPASRVALVLLALLTVPSLSCKEGGDALALPPGSVSAIPSAGSAAAISPMYGMTASGRPMTAAAPSGPATGLPPAPAKGPDPKGGKFTIAEATKGLGGKAGGKITATMETNKGTFHCELWDKLAPNTVANFVGLARGVRPWLDPATGDWVTRPYFDGLAFHRVIPGFMIQGGDPNTMGWLEGKPGYGVAGTGNPGFKFDDEIHPENHFNTPALLAMANAGVREGHGSNGSQFFVTISADISRLDAKHTIFGKCAEPDLAIAIAAVPRGKGDRPTDPVGIKKLTVTRE